MTQTPKAARDIPTTLPRKATSIKVQVAVLRLTKLLAMRISHKNKLWTRLRGRNEQGWHTGKSKDLLLRLVEELNGCHFSNLYTC